MCLEFSSPHFVLCTFNKLLFDAQYETLMRKIGKRHQKLTELQDGLHALARDKKPTMDGTEKFVKSFMHERHIRDIFTVPLEKLANGLPKLSFELRRKLSKQDQE